MEEFLRLVKEMRYCQKNYFKTRDRSYLIKSKNLEKQVDAEIEDLLSEEKG